MPLKIKSFIDIQTKDKKSKICELQYPCEFAKLLVKILKCMRDKERKRLVMIKFRLLFNGGTQKS